MWKVYKRIVPNGRVYIGITKQSLEERMRSGYPNNREFALDIIKYGKENIISEVLEEYTDYDTAIEREWYYIQQYKDICYNKIGNTKRKSTFSKSSKIPSCTDVSAQSRLHRNSSTETPAHYKTHLIPITMKPKGRHKCPISVYDASGKYLTTYPDAKTASKETGCNNGDIISCCRGFRSDGQPRYQVKGYIFRYAVDKLDDFPDVPVACKKVEQYTLDGEYIRTFNSLKEAFLYSGASISGIGQVCRGLRKQSGGFIWKYVDNINTEKEVG